MAILGNLQVGDYERRYLNVGLEHLANLFEGRDFVLICGLEPHKQHAPGVNGLAKRVIETLDNWSVEKVDPIQDHTIWYANQKLLSTCDAIVLIGGPPNMRDAVRQQAEAGQKVFEIAAHAGKLTVFDYVLPY